MPPTVAAARGGRRRGNQRTRVAAAVGLYPSRPVLCGADERCASCQSPACCSSLLCGPTSRRRLDLFSRSPGLRDERGLALGEPARRFPPRRRPREFRERGRDGPRPAALSVGALRLAFLVGAASAGSPIAACAKVFGYHQVGARLWSFPGNRLNSSADAVGGPGRSSLLLFRLPETP